MTRPGLIATSRRRLGALCGLVLAGCNGSATINFVSVDFFAIDPPPTQVYRFDPQQCFHWVDEGGLLNIAMQFENISLAGPLGKVVLQVSFVLDTPPAGNGRDYSLQPVSVRGRLRAAAEDHRFVCHLGILSVTRRPGGHLCGSFRMSLQHMPGVSVFGILPQRPGSFLVFGTFDAVADSALGRAIRESTESANWQRPVRPASGTSQPASRP